jgi:hypothetical protein
MISLRSTSRATYEAAASPGWFAADLGGRRGRRRGGLLAGGRGRDGLRRAARIRVLVATGHDLGREGDQTDDEHGQQQHVERANRRLLLGAALATAGAWAWRRVELELELEVAVVVVAAPRRLRSRRRSIAPRRARSGWQLVIHWHQSYRRDRRSSAARW